MNIKIQVILSHPVPSLLVSAAKQASHNCKNNWQDKGIHTGILAWGGASRHAVYLHTLKGPDLSTDAFSNMYKEQE